MAQLQDIIAKRKELMGTNSNLSYNDAMAQARQQVAGTTPTVTPVQPTPAPVPVTTQPEPVTQAPVTPVAPVTPPVQPTPSSERTQNSLGYFMDQTGGNLQQSQELFNKAKQATPPVTPTVATTTPVAPVTPDPVKAPVKPTEAPIDYNQGLGREQDIAKNLQTFKDQGMTADAIKNASGYNTASPEKKAQIDGFLTAMTTPVAMDQKDIVKSLIAGVNVPKQSTRAYNNAVVMADEFKRFNGMTDIQLLDNLKQGQIGSEMSSLLSQNPNFAKANEQYKKIQQTNSINRATNYAMNAISGKETPVTDDLTKIESKYSVPLGADEKAYNDYVVTNPEVVASATQVKQLTKQIADVTATYTQALKDLKTQYPDMPASALLTLMGSRTGETKSLLDSLESAKTTAKGDFDLAMKMAEGHYNSASKDIANQQLLDNKQKAMQMEADFAKKQAEFELNDPATQIKATMDEFAKLGIVAQGSLPQKIAEANAFIAKGGTLGEYVNNLRKLYMEKPEYKKIQSLQQGQLSDVEKFQLQSAQSERSDIRNFQQQIEIAKMNGDISRQNYLFQMQNDPEKQKSLMEIQAKLAQDKSLFDVLGKNAGTYKGNRGYDLAGKLGDPMVSGGNWTVKSVDQAGEFGIPYKVGIKKPYGNTVVMVDENGNEVRYSHLDTIGVKPGDKIAFGDVVGTRGNTGNVKGGNGEILTADQLLKGRGAHLDIEIKDTSGRLLSQNEQIDYLKSKKSGTQGGYNDSNIELLAELANMDASARNTALKAQGIPLKAVTDYQALAKSGKIPPTESQKQSALQIISSIQDISSMDWNDATGIHFFDEAPRGSDWATAKSKIENLVASVTLPNLGMLKGPMSDNDLKFVKGASSKLDITQNDSEFEKQLVELYNISARKAGLKEIKTLGEIPKSRIIAGQDNTSAGSQPSSSDFALLAGQGITFKQ